jgi:hypothetical protein
MTRVGNPGFWLRELEFLASVPDGGAQDRWLKLMEALRLAPVGLSEKPAGARQEAGYLDVVEVVRDRKWKIGINRDNPLVWVAREAKRHFREGEHGTHRGIVTVKGAHNGLRNPYREAESPIGEEAPRVRLRMALEVRLQNAPDYVPITERFPPEYRGTYELSPEDGDEAKDVPFEKIALKNGFDEFSVRALMYRVRGVTQKNAFEMEEEDHGKCTKLAVQSAWRDLDRHGEWQAFQDVIKRIVHPGTSFESAVDTRKAATRRQRNEKRGLLSIDQVARQLGRTVSEIDGYIRSRKLLPANELIPMRFHPHACDRLAREYFSRRGVIIDDSATNLAARARNGLIPINAWGWPHDVTLPPPRCKGKNRGPKK